MIAWHLQEYPNNFGEINSPIDVAPDNSLFKFKSNLSDTSHILFTYDSSDVYFFIPNIYPATLKKYEYRVKLNDTNIISNWKIVNQFSDVEMGAFKKGYGFLGGYKTTWGNFITVELREFNTEKILSTSTVYWKQIKPFIRAIYTSKNYNEFLKQLVRPWDSKIEFTAIPKQLKLLPNNNNLIFLLNGGIYQKQALEYLLIKDGDTLTNWKQNDFDNSIIWLSNLNHGSYKLLIRFAKQRHNICEYAFDVMPYWWQSGKFYFFLGAFTGLFFLLSALTIFIYSSRKKQKKLLIAQKIKQNEIQLELKSLRSQLNPHFIFNSLSSIQSLINKNDVGRANKYLTNFADLMRETLSGNSKEMNSISQEIKVLSNYLQLEQLRFNFTYKINVAENLITDIVEMPSLLLQPLVENAVKHGIAPLNANGKIIISIFSLNKNLLIDIFDNGKGFNDNVENSGMGLKLTKDRIKIFNQSLKKEQVQMKFNQNTPTGTIVHLIFYNWL